MWRLIIGQLWATHQCLRYWDAIKISYERRRNREWRKRIKFEDDSAVNKQDHTRQVKDFELLDQFVICHNDSCKRFMISCFTTVTEWIQIMDSDPMSLYRGAPNDDFSGTQDQITGANMKTTIWLIHDVETLDKKCIREQFRLHACIWAETKMELGEDTESYLEIGDSVTLEVDHDRREVWKIFMRTPTRILDSYSNKTEVYVSKKNT